MSQSITILVILKFDNGNGINYDIDDNLDNQNNNDKNNIILLKQSSAKIIDELLY